MRVVDAAVVGRERELARIEGFAGSPVDRPAALVIQGDAGIGKTTLWRLGLRALDESGFRVLSTTPAASERSLPLSAFTDLFEEVFSEVRTELPAPQRHAFEVALAVAEPSDPATSSERVLRAATRSALQALAQGGPVALAIDDCQWLDAASATALTYALRRLGGEPVRCLFAVRCGEASHFDVGQLGALPVEVLEVGPLSVGATQRLLVDELGVTYPRLVIRRLVETSGGNPFYALELSRGLEREGTARAHGAPVLSQSLDELISDRLGGVSERARRLLGLVSLLPSATIRLLDRVDALDGLDEAVSAGLLEVEGATVRFTHPLLAAGAQARLGPEERRMLHEVLAGGLEDPVDRALQLARARVSESEETAAEIAAAASIAFRRAQPTIAAELAEAAARLTPDSVPERRRERRLLAATSHAQAGSHEVAGELLDELIPQLQPGVERAGALRLRAKVTPDIGAQKELLLRALDETDDLSIRVEANGLLVRNHLYSGDLPSALAAAREADALAHETRDPRQVAAATTIHGMMEIWAGGAADPDVLERAHALAGAGHDLPADTYSNPHTLLAVRSLYRYEADEARREYAAAVAAAELAGDVDSLETYWWGLAQLEVRAGRFDEAGAIVARLRESVETYDLRRKSLRWIEGVLATYEGRVDVAHAALDEVIAQSESEGNWFFVVYGRSALGFLELSTGDAPAAIAAVDPVLSLPFVVDGDPGQTGILPIAAEALIATGELDRASAVVAHLEARGNELSHPWCVASAGRCRGLLLGAAREFESAFAVFGDALEQHDLVPAPFERARTLLALGSVQGRARKRRAARDSLEAAASVFEDLGTPLWVQRASAELDRVGGRAEAPGELTPHERRIAGLVREGLTNKEVAATLFVSDRTVESALTQIYRKLDVRSRTELARKLGSDA